MSTASYRRSYAADPGLEGRVVELLDAVFGGIRETIDRGSTLGLVWSQSTPFVYEAEGRILSHVGVLDMELVLDGDEQRVAIVHGVATHPEHRRRGYYRRVMDEALAWCDARYETVLLNTGNREFYEPFDFRWLPEHRFRMPWTAPPSAAEARIMRRLDYENADDVGRLRALLRERSPLSHRLGVVRETQAFAFNRAREAPHYSEDLDAVVCYELADSTLQLYDVVARRLPSLAEIASRVEGSVDQIECYFTPDRFANELDAERHVLFGDEYLMARGPFPPEGDAFMLPSPARC